jgi:hypothetical protein
MFFVSTSTVMTLARKWYWWSKIDILVTLTFYVMHRYPCNTDILCYASIKIKIQGLTSTFKKTTRLVLRKMSWKNCKSLTDVVWRMYWKYFTFIKKLKWITKLRLDLHKDKTKLSKRYSIRITLNNVQTLPQLLAVACSQQWGKTQRTQNYGGITLPLSVTRGIIVSIFNNFLVKFHYF